MRRATDRVGQEASEMARAAREEGRRALDDAKRRAANRADEMARATDAAADELDRSGDESISGYGHSLASMMRQFAGGLRERDIDDFAAELARFARRHPAAFLAGSVAVGFGLARVLKAQNGGSLFRESSAEADFYGDFEDDYGSEQDDYDPAYEAGEYDSSGYGYGSRSGSGDSASADGLGAARRDPEAETDGASGYDAATGGGDAELPGGRYIPGNTGASRASPDGTGISSSRTASSLTGSEDDTPTETPESDAQSGPRKGDLP